MRQVDPGKANRAAYRAERTMIRTYIPARLAVVGSHVGTALDGKLGEATVEPLHLAYLAEGFRFPVPINVEHGDIAEAADLGECVAVYPVYRFDGVQPGEPIPCVALDCLLLMTVDGLSEAIRRPWVSIEVSEDWSEIIAVALTDHPGMPGTQIRFDLIRTRPEVPPVS